MSACEPACSKNDRHRQRGQGEDGAPGFYNNLWLDYGTTTTGRTSIVIDPPNGRLPALTPEAQTRRTSPEAQRLRDVGGGRSPAASWEDLPLPSGVSGTAGSPRCPVGTTTTITSCKLLRWVAILQEHIHEVSYIPLEGRPHIAPAIRQYAGDSRGHWEGETLVVETTNFRNKTIIRQVTGGTGDLRRPCMLSNATRASVLTRSTGSSRSTTRRRGQALDGLATHDAHSGSDVRVCVSRRQPTGS